MTQRRPPDPPDTFHRVRPLLGPDFFEATVWVWDLTDGYLPAEALCRTGLRHQRWFDDGVADGAFCRSLGQSWRGSPRGSALAAHCRQSHPEGPSWQLASEIRTVEALSAALRREPPPGLLLARGPDQAQALTRLALDHGIPLVLTVPPAAATASCVHLVWSPESAADADQLLAAAAALGRAQPLDTRRPEHHVRGLEAGSSALLLAKWLLQRRSHPRPDLQEPILDDGRALLARGDPGWPWATRFLPPRANLVEALLRPARRYQPPLALLSGGRLLVLGLGTGSLFCGESPLLCRTAVFADCKAVSAYNPVRQFFAPADVGRFKGEALVERLAARLEPETRWEQRREGEIHFSLGQRHALGQLELRISDEDPAAEARFSRLLDQLQPTLVVVAMGRSRDDNFTATAELRRRGIRHITPTAFPAVTHFKHILTDGERGPCYDCLQGHLPLDTAAPTLAPEERELFYGGTQPATLAETLPSAHSLLRLSRDLALPPAARPLYLSRELGAERCCFVGANRAEATEQGWLYGVDRPLSMVTFGVEDLVGAAARRRCSCGRLNVGASAEDPSDGGAL